MGLEAFREFIRQLDATSAGQHRQSSSPETPKTSSTGRSSGSTILDPRRTLLERRSEAAAMLADPFRLRLEADGVLSVKMLARVPARAWGLPSCLLEEIERMLGLLTARTCASDHFFAHRGQGKSKSPDTAEKPNRTERGGFCTDDGRGGGGRGGGKLSRRNEKGGARKHRQPQFEFDSRFQRSPTDPFGRPPRLERIQPCLGSRREAEKSGGDQPTGSEDDLPFGLWDRPGGSDVSVQSGGPDDKKRDTGEAKSVKQGPGLLPSFSSRGGGLLKDAKSGLTKQAPSNLLQQEPAIKQKRQQQTRQAAANEPARGGRAENPTSAAQITGPGAPASSRFTCSRARPSCGAVFSKASTLRIHEISHAAAPEYHRLRRAPQLGRDPAPALSEGAGAPAEKFRLRTTLPPSVRRELQQLQEEGVQRRRQSLLAGPGLSGTVATWAGVVSPARSTFGQSGGT